MDWRELHAEPFDAISSIGMVEHVGSGNIDNYARALQQLPQARAAGCSTTASRGCATPIRRPARSPSASSSPTRRRCTCRGSASRWRAPAWRSTHVEGFREDYAETLRHWSRQVRRQLAAGDRARRRGARARVAALPARGAPRLRERVPVGLPGARHAGVVIPRGSRRRGAARARSASPRSSSGRRA